MVTPNQLPEASTPDAAARPSRGSIIAASVVGTSIEWYDYYIFGTAAALVFGSLFFPGISTTAATLAAFATFGVGFLARPLGAVVIGHFGDTGSGCSSARKWPHGCVAPSTCGAIAATLASTT